MNAKSELRHLQQCRRAQLTGQKNCPFHCVHQQFLPPNKSHDIPLAIFRQSRKLISEIRERFSNLESKRIYAVAHYLDPRFKDQFVPNRFLSLKFIHGSTNIDEEMPPSPKKKCISLRPARINCCSKNANKGLKSTG
uniref:Uncharacterized protein n=1 Tax=Globodera rostochiensis TaxID=31243 RepID=A0A914H1I4_GLORO